MTLDNQEQPVRATGNASGAIAAALLLAVVLGAAIIGMIDQLASAAAHIVTGIMSR